MSVSIYLTVNYDGEWTVWTDWSTVNGERVRTRACANPNPVGSGALCEGAATETEAGKNVVRHED